jgi:hypothetical protein
MDMKNHVNVEEWVAMFEEVGLDEAKREQGEIGDVVKHLTFRLRRVPGRD